MLTITIGISNAQSDVIVDPPEYIKTIILRSLQTNNYAPIVKLGDPLLLEFDDLSDSQAEYTYKIEHYDYDWKVSKMIATEYISGYDNDWIREFENSFNTLQPYTYYKLILPNDKTQIKKTGNYLISILDSDKEILFTRPFIVYQTLVDVGVSVHKSRDIATINSKQNVEFSINHPDLLINNPSQEIKVVVYQNNDWNTAIKNIKPQFYRGTQLLYKYSDKVSFWAGNEYLFFDSKEIRNATNNIAKSRLDGLFHTYLYTDEMRKNRPYTFYPDVNGNFVVRTIDSDVSATEADYSYVHFTLQAYTDLGEDDIYVYGDFNDWQLTKENKMSYNERLKLYDCTMLLKQGFYNYTYVTANNKGIISNDAVEGSFYQTENDYSVLVYYKPIGSRYDQVIGYGKANSENLRN
ncbi:type IX secretion system plug protein [Aureibaculum algae]|uniref:type IX secretion system plug protein n=1 Tax=Aureibaculum algae TaxID=2584122 RepID=UPI0015864038|nr:type IX secretion system plug protein domain-containing protein [Aureibaculum algae]